MSRAARLRSLAALVGIALLWPAVQHGLSRVAESDPWELFGFAMYTVPHPRVQVELRVRVNGRELPLPAAGSLRREIDEFARRKTTLGRWVSGRAFGQRLLERHEDWEAVVLVLHRWRLDRESARWVVESETVTQTRGADS